MLKKDILMPRYMYEFNCIGNQCEDNCCYEWRVFLNESTYKKYKRIKNLEIKPLVDKYVIRNRSNVTIWNYGKIKMSENGNCPFLDEHKLCKMQNLMGEEYLSSICSLYPRKINEVNGVLEMSLDLSCTEAARTVLFNKNIMEFEQMENKYSYADKNVGCSINTEDIKLSNTLVKYFWDLRIFCIDLIQNRSYRLWERLIILGLFLSKVQQYEENNIVDEIPVLIEYYNNLILGEQLREELEKIPVGLNVQMKVINAFMNFRAFMGISKIDKVYDDCVKEFLEGIDYKEKMDIESITAGYKKVYEEYYEPYMKEHEYILENDFVNTIFRELFPINNDGKAFDNYVMLIVQYAIKKIILTGLAGYNKMLNEEIIARFMYAFSRGIEHNKQYLLNMTKAFKDNGLDNMAYMAILLKN